MEGQNEIGAYAVVRLQVVNVLAKDEGPEVFAEELYDVEGVVEARAVAGESAIFFVKTFLLDCFFWF